MPCWRLLIMFGIYRGLTLSVVKGERRPFGDSAKASCSSSPGGCKSFLQKECGRERRIRDWRPSVRRRHAPLAWTAWTTFDLLRWICHRHGFGQFIQYIEGKLTVDSEVLSRLVEEKMIRRTEASHAGVFVETIVAPKFEHAVAQAVQMPGVSGLPNNTVLLEFSSHQPDEIDEIVTATQVVTPLGFNVCVLRSSELRFGYRKEIHIWLTGDDFQNAALMILLAYIIVGHPDWTGAEIKIFPCYPAESMDQELEKLNEMITQGRLPIARHNLTPVPLRDDSSIERAVEKHSSETDLAIMGFRYASLANQPRECLLCHPGLSEVLFVSANEQISIF